MTISRIHNKIVARQSNKWNAILTFYWGWEKDTQLVLSDIYIYICANGAAWFASVCMVR